MFILIGISFKSQTVVINEKLLLQLTKNQSVRLTSNKLLLDSYEKQKEMYDKINKKLTQIVAIQEYIYQNLTNVNMAIKQSKRMVYLYKNIEDIGKLTADVLVLTGRKPHYAVLLNEYYFYGITESIKLKKEVTEIVLNEENDFLMDPYDRENLLEKVFSQATIIKGNLMYIKLRLETAKEIPYINQIPGIGGYVNIDKLIVGDIIQKYKYVLNKN